MKKQIGWKFIIVYNGKYFSQYDDSEWRLGEWRKVSAPTEQCIGLNCSQFIPQARNFVSTNHLAKVEFRGKVIAGTDKYTCEEMRIVRVYQWSNKLQKLYDDYNAKCNALYDDYNAKCNALYDDYNAKRKPLDDDYNAKRKPLDDDYNAKCNALYDDYNAKRNALLKSIHNKMVKFLTGDKGPSNK